MKTQKEMLLGHLIRRQYITAGEALEMYGISRLAARALEMGLKSSRVKTKNRFGQVVSIARYYL